MGLFIQGDTKITQNNGRVDGGAVPDKQLDSNSDNSIANSTVTLKFAEIESDLSITKNSSVTGVVLRRIGNIINMKTTTFKSLTIGDVIIPAGFRPTEELYVPAYVAMPDWSIKNAILHFNPSGALTNVLYANTYGSESQTLNSGNVASLFNTTYIVD